MSTITITPGRASNTSAPAQLQLAPRGRRKIIPSAKVREKLKTTGTRTATRRSTRLAPDTQLSFRDIESNEDEEDEEERETTLQTLVKLVGDLKETIEHQGTIIENTQTELVAIREEQQGLWTQNTELQEEIRTLRGQLSAYSASLPATRSWASVAAGSGAGQTTINASTTESNEQPLKERNCLRISTQPPPPNADPGNPTFTRYLPIEAANSYIRDALSNTDSTKEVKIAGVGTTKTGYVIRFRDEHSWTTAETNTGWLEKLGNDTKLAKPRFGVVVHRFPTEGISLPENKQEVIHRIMEENEMQARNTTISDIAWLKQSDKPLGVSASLGLWFDTPDAAEWTVSNGILHKQRYIESVEKYQMKRKSGVAIAVTGMTTVIARQDARRGVSNAPALTLPERENVRERPTETLDNE
ncbi:uncharacterized protein PV06_11676 [Exophiala oligosperma]|uniref:Uncharacterized protein n=1 Tax=Exophiala oligosperma TaxID=215243 RepID=A0A0D2A6V1_9EURO|nr:uncharacterized protein PV06_11676 [Exophiala oligosperma]KIW36021.1 hypothetical protein PV06_11676 [Exophiala oligosperma]